MGAAKDVIGAIPEVGKIADDLISTREEEDDSRDLRHERQKHFTLLLKHGVTLLSSFTLVVEGLRRWQK